MKRILPLLAAAACCGLLTGCANRIWPDGASVKMIHPQIVISSLGSATISADELSWVGTNGFQVIDSTNASPTIATPVRGLLLH